MNRSRTRPAFRASPRSQPRTVDTGRPSSPAIFRCPAPAAQRARQLPAAQLTLDYIPVTVYREHDASKRQPAAFPGYLAKDHTGRAAPIPDVITVPPHTKKDNPEGLPSHHPQPQ